MPLLTFGSWFVYFFFGSNEKIAEETISDRNTFFVRNGRNDGYLPKWSDIYSETKQGVFLYRSEFWNGKYRPIQNGIDFPEFMSS